MCRFYHRHCIRRKAITKYKTPPPDKQEKYNQIRKDALEALKEAWAANEKVIYLDEVVFTKHTIPKLDYQVKYKN